ncbi:leucine-rich repeat-containing 66 [Pelobates cultripes]|nr:leucine-rich repeat-containing 66 [Pelobates cultripes]
MVFVGLIALVSSLVVVGSTEVQGARSMYPFSKCQWDKGYSMICSFTGMTALPLFDPGHNPRSKPYWFSSVHLWRAMKHIDLSNNVIQTFNVRTFYTFLGLETLNLSTNHIYRVSLYMYGRDRKQDLKNVILPALKTLLLDRNRLNTLPEGLGNLKSLQTLQVSFNSITRINQDDFANCTELKTIDLRGNRIFEIHPDAFRDTIKLKVLSLRSNALISVTPLVFMYSHMMPTDVDISDNPWTCDCRLWDLRNVLSFLSAYMNKEWNVTCRAPIYAVGQPLLSIKVLHSACAMSLDSTNATKINVTAGKQIVLSCDISNTAGNQNIFWWTPRGLVFAKHKDSNNFIDKMKNLVLTISSSNDEGLYLCVSYLTQKRKVYKVYVHKEDSTTLRRSPRDVRAEVTQGKTQQEFTLAVCLSVIISFICAFCLGVFVRPFLEKLWKKHCKFKKSKKQNSEATYKNEGFTEEPSVDGAFRNVSMNNKCILRDKSEADSSSGSCIIIHGGQKRGTLIENTKMTNHSEYSNPSEHNSVVKKDVESETDRHIQTPSPRIVDAKFQRRGTYNIMENKGESSDKAIPANNNFPEVKHVVSWEIDENLHENDILQISQKHNQSETILKYPDTTGVNNGEGVTSEILRSPKHKQLFPAGNQHFPLNPEVRGDEQDHTASNLSNGMDNLLHSRNSDSEQNRHLHSLDMHNQHASSSSSDDGSIFSFSLSNSLSDTSEFIDINSEDEVRDTQPHINDLGEELNVKSSQSPCEYTSMSASDLSTSTVSKKNIASPAEIENTDFVLNEGPTNEGTAPISQSSQGNENNFSKWDLQDSASNKCHENNKERTLETAEPRTTNSQMYITRSGGISNDKTTVNHSPCLILQKQSETTKTDQCTSGTSLSISDKSENASDIIDVARTQQCTQTQHSDITAAANDSYKREAVLHWLKTSTSDDVAAQATYLGDLTSEDEGSLEFNSQKNKRRASLDRISQVSKEDNLMGLAPEEIKDFKSYERKPTQKSSDMDDHLSGFDKFYKKHEYREHDFNEINANTPVICLDTNINGGTTSLPLSMNMWPSSKVSGNPGGYFIKRKKVFDAFSASLKNGQNIN